MSDAFFFPPFQLEPTNAQLWRGAEAIPLRRKTFAVLHYLVEHAGQLGTKEQLLEALWPQIYVSDSMPALCIHELRKTLGDEAKTPRFIETVHGRGYRFLSTVTTQPVSSSTFKVPSSDTQDSALCFGGSRGGTGTVTPLVGQSPDRGAANRVRLRRGGNWQDERGGGVSDSSCRRTRTRARTRSLDRPGETV